MAENVQQTEEIEVTPEMVSAGIEAACMFRLSDDDLEVVLPTVYRAMLRASAPI